LFEGIQRLVKHTQILQKQGSAFKDERRTKSHDSSILVFTCECAFGEKTCQGQQKGTGATPKIYNVPDSLRICLEERLQEGHKRFYLEQRHG
jgi:hypothetical protein